MLRGQRGHGSHTLKGRGGGGDRPWPPSAGPPLAALPWGRANKAAAWEHLCVWCRVLGELVRAPPDRSRAAGLLVWGFGGMAGCLPPRELLEMPGSVESGEAWEGAERDPGHCPQSPCRSQGLAPPPAQGACVEGAPQGTVPQWLPRDPWAGPPGLQGRRGGEGGAELGEPRSVCPPRPWNSGVWFVLTQGAAALLLPGPRGRTSRCERDHPRSLGLVPKVPRGWVCCACSAQSRPGRPLRPGGTAGGLGPAPPPGGLEPRPCAPGPPATTGTPHTPEVQIRSHAPHAATEPGGRRRPGHAADGGRKGAPDPRPALPTAHPAEKGGRQHSGSG